MTNDQHPSTSGSFFSGLVFGGIAGMAGYFLFGTEEGKRARKKLMEEWEVAKEHLVEQGVIEATDKTLPEMIQHSLQHITEPAKRKINTSQHTIEIRSSKKKDTKRFKGV